MAKSGKAIITCLLGVLLYTSVVNGTSISVETPMPPPAWAILERQLLTASTEACKEFFARYFDERGYLLVVERWGALDGADDAPENLKDWPLLFALGAPDDMLRMFKKGWEGHLLQYTAAKTKDVPFARDGMYYKEFHVMFDQAHIAEGLWSFYQQGLADPYDPNFQKRARRFAGFYLNEDPQAPNYDPRYKIIRSFFTGSRGPLLRKATPVDYVGDPVEPGRFTQLRGERNYQDMLGHFKDYGDIIGDNPTNLMATMMALNAYMVGQEPKYKNWLLEYVDAWVKRAIDNHGIVPSNIGLDGTIGGATGGKWYGGVWGWGFSVRWPQTGDKVIHLNHTSSALDGFVNAFMLTGDERYLDTWRQTLNNVNANEKISDGVKTYPHNFGDQGWYNYTPQKYDEGAFDIWYLTMKPEDRVRVSLNTLIDDRWSEVKKSPRFVRQEIAEAPWIRFLEGSDPDYPVKALQNDFSTLRQLVQGMRSDPTTPDTRTSEEPMQYRPVMAETLTQLMLGGRPNRPAQPLFSFLRYFDPERRRAGISEDIAALVDKVSADGVEVTLVNINPMKAHSVIVQAGAYGEHQFVSGVLGGKAVSLNGTFFTVRLEPGCGTRMVLKMKRFVNQPSLIFPWDRS